MNSDKTEREQVAAILRPLFARLEEEANRKITDFILDNLVELNKLNSNNIKVAGHGGLATALGGGTAIAGDYGNATAEKCGTAIVGYGGFAAAGEGGVIVITQWDGSRYLRKCAMVGEGGLKPNTPYRLDDNSGNFREV